MNYTSKRIVCRRPLYLLVSFHCLDLLVSTFRPRFSSHASFSPFRPSRTTYLPRRNLKIRSRFRGENEKRYNKKEKSIVEKRNWESLSKLVQRDYESRKSMEHLITCRACVKTLWIKLRSSFHSSESSTRIWRGKEKLKIKSLEIIPDNIIRFTSGEKWKSPVPKPSIIDPNKVSIQRKKEETSSSPKEQSHTRREEKLFHLHPPSYPSRQRGFDSGKKK